jgi:hypothetical protein
MPFRPPPPERNDRRSDPIIPRLTAIWHRRDQHHVPGVYVPERRAELAAEIVATSNYFKPTRRAW